MARTKNSRNRTKIKPTTHTMKLCLLGLHRHMENLLDVLEADEDEKVTLKAKMDAGKQMQLLASEVFGEELKVAGQLLISEQGEDNPYRPTLSTKDIEELEKKVEESHPELKVKAEQKDNVHSLIKRFNP